MTDHEPQRAHAKGADAYRLRITVHNPPTTPADVATAPEEYA